MGMRARWIYPALLTLMVLSIVACADLSWRRGPGQTILFETADPSADTKKIVEIVEQRLQGMRVIVSTPSPGKIAVWIPYSDAHRKAVQDYKVALEALRSATPRADDLVAAAKLEDEARDAAFARFASAGSPEFQKLAALGVAWDALARLEATLDTTKSEPISPEMLASTVNARSTYAAALKTAIEQYTSVRNIEELAQGGPENKVARDDLERLKKEFPAQSGRIAALVTAADALHAASADEVEPDVIESLLTARGELDFHIAVDPHKASARAYQDIEEIRKTFVASGPPVAPITVEGVPVRWIIIDRNKWHDISPLSHASESWNEDKYLLCYDDSALNNPHPHTLTHADPGRKPWKLTVDQPYVDPIMGITVPFRLDVSGAAYMYEFSEINRHAPMAIVLDGVVLTAPPINGAISDRGVITLGTRGYSQAVQGREAAMIHRRLSATALPVPLKRIP